MHNAHHQNELNEGIKNKMMCFICHCILFVISTYISRVNARKIAKNGNFKMQIYEANDISSCRAYNSEQNAVFF